MANQERSKHQPRAARTSWDRVATWYDGWVGEQGSEYHRAVAIPAVLELLQARPGDKVLDIGCGQGVLAPYISKVGASYVGVDASSRLVAHAQRRHQREGVFLVGNACRLSTVRYLSRGMFDAAVALFSFQDIDPLEDALASAAWALKPGARLVALVAHPAFQVPRQSGWGWDETRKLRYRRIDSYLTPLAVPMKPATLRRKDYLRRFHRPLGVYVNASTSAGFMLDRMSEIPAHRGHAPPGSEKAVERSRKEIPLFLALRFIRIGALPAARSP